MGQNLHSSIPHVPLLPPGASSWARWAAAVALRLLRVEACKLLPLEAVKPLLPSPGASSWELLDGCGGLAAAREEKLKGLIVSYPTWEGVSGRSQ